MGEPLRIVQKKRSERTSFVFNDDDFDYHIRDSSGTELTLKVPYLSLPADTDYRRWTPPTYNFTYLTFMCVILGLVQIPKHYSNIKLVALVVAVIWLVLVTVAMLIAPWLERQYISIPTAGNGAPVLLNDRHRPQVLAEIKARRLQALRARYARIDPADPLDQEFYKFSYLRDKAIISEEEYAVFLQRLGIDVELIKPTQPPQDTRPDVTFRQSSWFGTAQEFVFTSERLYFKSKPESFSVSYAEIAPEAEYQRMAKPSPYAIVPFVLALLAVAAPFYFLVEPQNWLGNTGFYTLMKAVALALPVLWLVAYLTKKYMQAHSILVPNTISKFELPDNAVTKQILEEIKLRQPVADEEMEIAEPEAHEQQQLMLRLAKIRQLYDTGLLDDEEAAQLMERAREQKHEVALSEDLSPERKLH